jgi:primosomal protein N' (replication factor Y)
VYHSRFSDAERVEIWNNLLNNKGFDVIIGVRSSVFLPFRQLGLIIVDEEHEPSYKQFEPSPRYHARNAAIVLASFHGAKTLLGTATPSLESYFNAKTEKYGLVELSQRYNDILLPEIQVVDTKEAYRKKMMTEHQKILSVCASGTPIFSAVFGTKEPVFLKSCFAKRQRITRCNL